MAARLQSLLAQPPEWMVAEMPPGYQTRLLEIQRLSADLHAMDRIGRTLWETGEPLREGVGTLLGALRCEVDASPGTAGLIAAALDDSRRLLVLVSGAASPVQKTNEELALAFQAVQFAAAGDRVVYVVNHDPATRPADASGPRSPRCARHASADGRQRRDHRHALQAVETLARGSTEGAGGPRAPPRAGRRAVRRPPSR